MQLCLLQDFLRKHLRGGAVFGKVAGVDENASGGRDVICPLAQANFFRCGKELQGGDCLAAQKRGEGEQTEGGNHEAQGIDHSQCSEQGGARPDLDSAKLADFR